VIPLVEQGDWKAGVTLKGLGVAYERTADDLTVRFGAETDLEFKNPSVGLKVIYRF